MLAEGKIRAPDLDLLVLTDSPEVAVRTVMDCYEKSCAEARRMSEAAQLRTGGMRGDRRADRRQPRAD
jgi:hypothetical protein